MFSRLSLLALEARENPVGPVVVDPIGIPVVDAPSVPVVSDAPSDATKVDGDIAQKILDQTIAALTRGW